MKKAQIHAEPFIIIFSLIVAVLVLIYGFNTVLSLKQKGDYAQLLDAQAEIKDVARAFYTLGEGSRRTLELRVPKDIKCFCFQNTEDNSNFDSNNIPSACGENPNEIKQRLQSSPNKQLIITPLSKKYQVSSFTIISKLYPEPDPLCIEIQNSIFKATIESKGSYVAMLKSNSI